MKNILVTGGCGYIGSVLVPKLLAENKRVTVVDIMWFGNALPYHNNLTVIEGDTRNIDESWFVGMDALVHLASVANDPCSDLNPKLSWEIGPLATMGLVTAAIRHHVKQFIYSSSGSVYGVNDAPQVTEDLTLTPLTEYNKTKMVTERVLLSYATDIIVQIVRPATICGYSPRMRLDVSVNMMAMQALTHGKMTVFGGEQVRPNIHIDDITDLYSFLLQHPDVQGIFNAGFENLSIREIAERVQQHTNAEIVITPSIDHRSYRLNSNKLLSTGFKPKKTVDNAIQEIIAGYQNGTIKNEPHYHNINMMKSLNIGAQSCVI